MTEQITAPAASAKPFSITLVGPAVPIFQELGVHIRNGYTVNRDYPIEFFNNGNVSLMIVLGNPDEHAMNQAKQSTDESVAREQAEYDRRVKDEAKRLVEMQQREELARSVAAEVAEHKRKIAAIEKQAAAALAKLQ